MSVIEQQLENDDTRCNWASTGMDRPQLGLMDSTRRSEAMAIWEMLDREIGNVPIMASYDWTDAWLNHYGDLVPHQFAVLSLDSKYVGIAMLTRGCDSRVGWLGERTWHLGTAGEPEFDSTCVEYNALLCRREQRDELFGHLFEVLCGTNDWDGLLLDGFASHELPRKVRDEPLFQMETRMARWIDLEEVRARGGDTMNSLGDSTRKNIRQSMRKHNMPRFEWAETVEHAHAIFDDLIRLHQARWNSVGKPGCYASQRFTNFHRELIDRLVPERMVLARVTSVDEVLGCSQLLIDRGRVLVYQGGRSLISQGSPGLVTDFLCMQESTCRGYSAYDFMAGDSIHKRRLSNRETPLCWAALRRPRWKYRIADTLRRGKRLWKSLTSPQTHSTRSEMSKSSQQESLT